jgi:hypothetical protein
MIDAEQARRDLLDDDRGFHVIRGLYSAAEVDAYRQACDRVMRHGRRIHERIMSDSVEDYVHPRSHDQEERTARIYQYFHNHRGDEIGRFLDRAVAIRDGIEKGWEDNPVYRAEKKSLFDYVIVTKYIGNKGMLPKHEDYKGPAPLPLIQFWVALSEPGKDYQNGNLVLYSRNGRRRRVESDLNMRKGDALIFDKSLSHEVELTQVAGEGALGRWTVLIGARAPRDSFWGAAKKRWLYGPPLYPVISRCWSLCKRLAAQIKRWNLCQLAALNEWYFWISDGYTTILSESLVLV